MSKKKVFSGIQPSGNLHIGNYLGAIVNWVQGQDEKENIFCIVDQHAITVPQDPKDLRNRIYELAKIFLAAGIDPDKSNIFVQSARPEHSELAWIINCFTYVGELARMTQFKDKAKGKHFLTNTNLSISVGLYDYPALMAADILLYDTDEVPVGEDQKQHVELTRDIAERLNRRYGRKLLQLPAFTTRKETTRIMSLTEPTAKMSKSDTNSNSRIEILDSPETIRSKFAKAVTDSGNEVRFDPKAKPGISNLLNIMSAATNLSITELENNYKNKNYGEFKNDVADAVIRMLEPLQKRYNELNNAEVEKVLKKGSDNVAPLAQATLARVKEAIGLGT